MIARSKKEKKQDTTPATPPAPEKETFVFEKRCPECTTYNYSVEENQGGSPVGCIHFTCKKCGHKYINWWYGSSMDGTSKLWYEILRKPFKAICIGEAEGITIESIYEAFESLDDDSMLIVLKNDLGQENVSYSRQCFIVDNRRKL